MEKSHSKSDGEVKQFLVIIISHPVILAGDDATFHRLLIPSKWAGAIIGKGGVMINQLRDEVKYHLPLGALLSPFLNMFWS